MGIFTQRDILYRTALEEIDDSTPIEKLMSPDPVSLQPHERLADAIRVMAEGGYRHLPLVDDKGRAAGLIMRRCFCFTAPRTRSFPNGPPGRWRPN